MCGGAKRVADNQQGNVVITGGIQEFVGPVLHHLPIGHNHFASIKLLLRGVGWERWRGTIRISVHRTCNIIMQLICQRLEACL